MRSQLKKILLALAVGGSVLGIVYCAYVYLGLPDVSVLQTKNPRTTALMLQRYRQARNEGKDLVIRQQWVAFERIPKLLKDTIRISEDAAFYQHQGMDFTELKIAIKKNWQARKYVRGASTITQQLAKNLYLTTNI
jgi:monofunctional biosynthetic peptidoglycan transglycosylase